MRSGQDHRAAESAFPTQMPPDSSAAQADSVDALVTPGAGQTAIRGGAMRVVGYAAGILLSLVSATLVIRHPGVAQFGRYVTTVSLGTISSSLLEGGGVWVAGRDYSGLRGAGGGAGMRGLPGPR